MLNNYIEIYLEVEQALRENKPVVALESTIISHEMAYSPLNIESTKKSEETARENEAVPATIGIINSKIKVGLTSEELDYMGKTKGILKASRSDIPIIVANKLDGATTVASTMIIAEMVGIKVLELANTNVSVICAGTKSILDIGLTL